MPPVIDSHAHTNFDAYDADRDEVYARARAAGLVAIIEIGIGVDGARAAVARAANEPLVHAAAGLHPTGLATWESDWEAFAALVHREPLVALGECGLDYHWMKSPRAEQKRAFRRQIALAAEVGLPYIVHCRDAEEDLLRILGDAGYTQGVVHCFSGTPAQATTLLELGMHLSFCGNVTYKKNNALRETARVVPLDRLLLETDSPFLAPRPKRGKRNEPAYVLHTATLLAELHDVDVDELCAQATTNTLRLFDRLTVAS